MCFCFETLVSSRLTMEEASQPIPQGVDAATDGDSSSHSRNPYPLAIEASIWPPAEKAAMEILQHLKPTVASEQRRKLIVEYLQKLIRVLVGIEIFPFGSFPLKTYLPGGDIDLTAIGIPRTDDTMASEVNAILEKEQHNQDSEFEVKGVQYIGAEVRLVKCVVQNIAVDISFNQIGGLCTLCFFEEVDRFIGKDHLFKRSIMLIKAWSYYEGYILGSHHGLMSTYALETLVLYIFHFFHSSMDGPLAVLYRFLYYYNKFNWDKYCISLRGPVPISSLPELSVEAFDNDGGDLLLTDDFLRSCVDFFSVPMRASEGKSRTFIRKHLNVVDPLRKSNNLGRSVSLGGFYRIRTGLAFGAQQLGCLLSLPAGSIGDEVNKFFMNTLDRHGSGERPDVQDLVPRLSRSALVESSGVELMQPVGKLEKEKVDELSSESLTFEGYKDLNKEMKSIIISGLDECEGIVALQKSPSHKQRNSTSDEINCIPSERLTGDDKDIATSSTSLLRNMTESPKTASTKDDDILDFRNTHHAQSQTMKDLKLDQINSTNLGPSSNAPSTRDLSSDVEIIISMQPDICETDSSLSNTGRVGNFGNGSPSERLYLVDHGMEGNIGNCINEPSLYELSDLSGDYDMHLNNLNYAVWCHDVIMKSSIINQSPPLINQSPPLINQSPPHTDYNYGMDVWTHGSTLTGSLPRPLFYPTPYYSMNIPLISSSYNTDDAPKPRGLGTFFPNVNYQLYKERNSPGKAKNAVSPNRSPRSQNNLQADTPQDTSSAEKGSHEPAIRTQLASGGNERGKLPAQLDIPQSSSRHAFKAPPNASGIVLPLEYGKLEFGSLGPVSVEALTKEHGRKSDLPISLSKGSGFTRPLSSSLRPAVNSNKGRKSQSYRMKDEDFPPLG